MWEVKYDNKKHLSANYLMICRTMHHKSATHHVHNYSDTNTKRYKKIQKDTKRYKYWSFVDMMVN